MSRQVNYNFTWDRGKADYNRKKHEVSFEQAATVFRDPRAVSIFDNAHSASEGRWITLGISSGSGVLAVHHTFEEINVTTVRVRIFSSRKATKHEITQYMEK